MPGIVLNTFCTSFCFLMFMINLLNSYHLYFKDVEMCFPFWMRKLRSKDVKYFPNIT